MCVCVCVCVCVCASACARERARVLRLTVLYLKDLLCKTPLLQLNHGAPCLQYFPLRWGVNEVQVHIIKAKPATEANLNVAQYLIADVLTFPGFPDTLGWSYPFHGRKALAKL